MAYTVPFAFSQFIERISLGGTHMDVANKRRDAVMGLLSSEFEVLEAFPFGSIVRGTALKGVADVDVLVALNYGNHLKGKTPKQALEDVRTSLSDYNARLVKKNGQAVTLYFKSWPNVDIVPAVQLTNGGYHIPDMNRGVWIYTNPLPHAVAMADLPRGGLELVRMIKKWNLAHSEYLQSFHIETLVLTSSTLNSSDWPWTILSLLEHALKTIPYGLYHPRDSNSRVDEYLGISDRNEVEKRLKTAYAQALDAWHSVYPPKDDAEASIGIYRKMFGEEFPAYG